MPANPINVVYPVASTVVGPQAPKALDWLPFGSATIGVWAPDVGNAYSLEFTLDPLDIDDGGGIGAVPNPNVRWFTLDDMPVGSTGNQYSVIYYPFRAVRLNIATITGNIELKIMQASSGRW